MSLVRERLAAAGRGPRVHPGRVPPHHPPGRGARGLPEARRGGELRRSATTSWSLRLTGREVCRACGAIYHVRNMPSKVKGVVRPLRRPDLHAARRRDRVDHEPPGGLQAPDRAPDRVLPRARPAARRGFLDHARGDAGGQCARRSAAEAQDLQGVAAGPPALPGSSPRAAELLLHLGARAAASRSRAAPRRRPCPRTPPPARGGGPADPARDPRPRSAGAAPCRTTRSPTARRRRRSCRTPRAHGRTAAGAPRRSRAAAAPRRPAARARRTGRGASAAAAGSSSASSSEPRLKSASAVARARSRAGARSGPPPRACAPLPTGSARRCTGRPGSRGRGRPRRRTGRAPPRPARPRAAPSPTAQQDRHAARVVRRRAVRGCPRPPPAHIQPHVRDGEVVVRAGERRVEAQRGLEGPCRLVEPAELEVRVAEVEVLEGDLPPARCPWRSLRGGASNGAGSAAEQRARRRQCCGPGTCSTQPSCKRTTPDLDCSRRRPRYVPSPDVDECRRRRYAWTESKLRRAV